MPSTQQQLPIADIRDNLIFLKNGSVTAVIETSAVNFGLLFDTEQVSIIQAFAGLLNSLSFPIQIIIRSQRLDVSSYLGVLDGVISHQPNPLLKNMTQQYRSFVESLIKENQVLDKRFYIAITAAGFELGILPGNQTEKTQKALTVLNPRVDHLAKQLQRLGLKAKTLETSELVKLFYGVYNFSQESTAPQIRPGAPTLTGMAPRQATPAPIPQAPPRPMLRPLPKPPIPTQSQSAPFVSSPTSNNPFVVEELKDDLAN